VLLTKSRGQVDLRLVILRVVFEFLQIFRVVFNTTFPAWKIDKSVWAFQAIRWVLIRGLMLPKVQPTTAGRNWTAGAMNSAPPSARLLQRSPRGERPEETTNALPTLPLALPLLQGYDAYIKLFYALAAVILLSLLLAFWLAVVLKKDDATANGWMGR
jgi:hypothetical protein